MFKLGDKVIIIISDTICRKYKHKIGKITTVDKIKKGYSNRYDYDVTFNDGFIYPFAPNEIRKVTNQQLEFNFMQK